ncbi:hypothetical protein GBAR_LOCUS12873 [Geodia barretti]|uniref:Uncharacterized protein n=1 Tax=Geodia barretti TaxID=519541 RepID=A0AA35WM14_GEOBA|nr:hypothetical protein GBAR_LOCUS12873 [Geodia barretti]
MKTRGVLRLVLAGVLLVLVFLSLPANTQTCRREGDVEEDAVCSFIISAGEDYVVNVTEALCGEIRLELQNNRSSCRVWTGKADNSIARGHVTFGESNERTLSFCTDELLQHAHQKYSISCRYDSPPNVEGSITFLIFIDKPGDEPQHTTTLPSSVSNEPGPSQSPTPTADPEDTSPPSPGGNSTSMPTAAKTITIFGRCRDTGAEAL